MPAAGIGIQLFTKAHSPGSGDPTPLFVRGHLPASGDATPLFTRGHLSQSTSLSLFVKVDEPPSVETSLPLFAYGSTAGVSGRTQYTPLYAYSGPSGQTPHITLPLFVNGAPSHFVSGELPLFAEGGTTRVEESVTLFALGPSGVSEYVPLYASGEGSTPGAYPASLAVPLFIRRPLGEYVSLFALAPGTGASGDVSLVTLGKGSDTQAVSLSVPEAVGSETQAVELYTHGF